MGAGPTDKEVARAMASARKLAEDYTKRTGLPCTPQLQRASNGEACIIYRIVRLDGTNFTLLSVKGEE